MADPATPAQMPDLPDFLVKIGGQQIEPAVRDDILRLDVHEEVGRLARASLLVRNWDDEKNEVTRSDEDLFAPGAEIEIAFGWGGEFTTVFDGIVVQLGGVFLPDRQPVVEVTCRCRGVLLGAVRRTRILEEATDGDLASAVAGDYGLTASAEPGAKQPFIVQSQVSDWDHLRARARALGFVLYVRGKELVFGPPRSQEAPSVTLEWNSSVLELDLHQDVTGRAAGVVASAWDPESLEPADAEVAAGDAPLPVGDRPDLPTALGQANWPKRPDREGHAGAVGPEELDARARAGIGGGALAHSFGRGRTHGLPDIRIDSTVDIQGVGTRLGGPYYVSAVRHTLDLLGYFTEFQLGLPPSLSPSVASPEHTAGSLAVGTVDDIDDPNGWGRVRVLLPWLDPEAPSVWARLALPGAGPDRGFFWIPEVGDEVVVGFLGEDIRFPMVLGSLWNGQHAPPESLDASKNDIRSIVSRAGHRFTLDDADSAPKVAVETAAGQSVVLDDSGGSEKIEVRDKAGNRLSMDSKGIVLEAAGSGNVEIKAPGGKVTINGTQIEATSTGPAKLQSSAALDLQAAATLGITGALVKINS